MREQSLYSTQPTLAFATGSVNLLDALQAWRATGVARRSQPGSTARLRSRYARRPTTPRPSGMRTLTPISSQMLAFLSNVYSCSFHGIYVIL